MRSLYGSDSLARWYIFHNPSAEVVSSFIISLMEIGLESASKLNRNLDNPIPSVRRDSCDGRCVVCLSITNKLGLIRQNTGFALSKLSRRPNLHTARLHNRDEFRIVIGSITDNDGADNTRRAYTKRLIWSAHKNWTVAAVADAGAISDTGFPVRYCRQAGTNVPVR